MHYYHEVGKIVLRMPRGDARDVDARKAPCNFGGRCGKSILEVRVGIWWKACEGGTACSWRLRAANIAEAYSLLPASASSHRTYMSQSPGATNIHLGCNTVKVPMAALLSALKGEQAMAHGWLRSNLPPITKAGISSPPLPQQAWHIFAGHSAGHQGKDEHSS